MTTETRAACRRRRGRRQYRHKYVRLLSGRRLFQARAWRPVVGSVNLGLYGTEWDAWKAVVVWLRAGCDPCRGLPAKVLPKWVQRAGAGFVSRRTGGELFLTAEAAHRAAVRDKQREDRERTEELA